METIIELYAKECSRLRNLINNVFLGEHSNIYRWNHPGGFFIIISGDYKFTDLGVDGKQLQSRLIKEFNAFRENYTALTAKLLSKHQDEAKVSLDKIFEAVTQESNHWYENISEVQSKVMTEFNVLINVMDSLYDPMDAELLLVVDTNALLTCSDLDRWRIVGVKKFTLMLMPTVLSELDYLKIDGKKTEEVRNKAKKLTKQIKEYMRRGDLSEGVTIVKDKVLIRSIATEPNFKNMPSWLNENNGDDKLLASFIEVTSNYPRTAVYMVTVDTNLLNKLKFAKLPHLDLDVISENFAGAST